MRRVVPFVLVAACSRSESAPPVVAVEPAGSNARIETMPAADASAVANEPITGGCETGFVEIDDAGKTTRYALGRELAGTDRGAKHAYVEEVIHQNGQVVLHLEALAHGDSYGGHLSLTLVEFHEPTSFPATFENGYAEYAPPDAKNEERRIDAPRVEITRWGPEGSWVEGTFGPGSAPPVMSAVPASVSSAPRPRASGSAMPPRVMRPTVPYRGRFRVCRSKDWHVRH
jgi:hypothetical protein